MSKGKKESPESRFWKGIDTSGECWLWRGSKSRTGYGQLSYGQRPILTHRFSYELRYGPIPQCRFVCHRCDVPACCNPEHLFLGTPDDNQKDMARKFRSRTNLTREQVLEIRASAEPKRALARRFGLKSHKTISNIKDGLIFRHV